MAASGSACCSPNFSSPICRNTLPINMVRVFSVARQNDMYFRKLKLPLLTNPKYKSRFQIIPGVTLDSSSADDSNAEMDEMAMRFAEGAKNGNLIPLYKCIFSDHLTPVLAYRCLVMEDDRIAPSFLFESVEHDSSSGTNAGRYSFVGAQPAIEIIAKENKVTIMDHEEGSTVVKIVDDPISVAKEIVEGLSPQFIGELPDVFCGGCVGFFSYDTGRYVENKKLPFTSAPTDDRNLPDIHLGFYNDVIVFDHVDKIAYVIHWVQLDRHTSIEDAYSDGKRKLDVLLARVQDIESPKLSSGHMNWCTRHFENSLRNSSMSSEAFKKIVLEAKEHILAGDIFQIVLSLRFECLTYADPFDVYRVLRVVNPSPYMCYLQASECILVGSSPEILTRVKNNKITNRPLAGTIRRGRTEEEDSLLEKQLLDDEKQRAEHIMLVDLGRNDVGRVSKPSSVKVEKLMNIEKYSLTQHISSTITGELLDNITCWDVLRAAFPAGTVSGAPKVKAMELIDEMEVTRRGPYSGGFGYITYSGDVDIALALHTIVFPTASEKNRRKWVAHLQSGARIVADSDPDDENRKCYIEAVALKRAIDLAEEAFIWSL